MGAGGGAAAAGAPHCTSLRLIAAYCGLLRLIARGPACGPEGDRHSLICAAHRPFDIKSCHGFTPAACWPSGGPVGPDPWLIAAYCGLLRHVAACCGLLRWMSASAPLRAPGRKLAAPARHLRSPLPEEVCMGGGGRGVFDVKARHDIKSCHGSPHHYAHAVQYPPRRVRVGGALMSKRGTISNHATVHLTVASPHPRTAPFDFKSCHGSPHHYAHTVQYPARPPRAAAHPTRVNGMALA